MTTVAITDDYSYDPKGKEWVPSGGVLYRCVLPAMVTGIAVGRPAFSLKEGFGIRPISDPSQPGRFGYSTVMLKLAMDKPVLAQVKRAQALGQRIVVDVDDFFPGLHEANIAHRTTDPSVNKGRNRDWHERIVLAADTITCSTPFLRDYYIGQGHEDVRMIRNGILPEMFHGKQREHTDKRPIIGWMGAVGWRSNDLEELSEWLPRFIERKRLTFHHSGHITLPPGQEMPGNTYAYEKIGIPRRYCSIYPQVPITRLPDLFCFDIGLVPLSEIVFNKAKSSLKGLEYTAAGLPFVASPLPEYELLAEKGVGVVARSDSDWVSEVTRLLDRDERIKAVEAARAVVMTSETIYARADQWKEVLG